MPCWLLTNSAVRTDVCCDEFPVPQTDRKSKQAEEHSDAEYFICNQYREKLVVWDT